MIFRDMPEAEYHARPELSSTGARRLLDSPARYRYWADRRQPGKTVFDVGSAAHARILGVGSPIVVYPDEHLTPTGRASTKQATVQWVDEQRAVGLIPVSPADVRHVEAMAESVLSNPTARAILEGITEREVSIFTNVEGVPVRARFDLYNGTRAGDLKTTRDASPKSFNRSVGSYGYHVQQRWYEDAHEAETGAPLESFTFVVVESAPPHLVGVYSLDVMWQDLAKTQAKRARDLFRECTESGVWPGYEAQTLTAPTWAVFDADDEEIKV